MPSPCRTPRYGPLPPPPWGARVDQTGRALLLPGPRRSHTTGASPPPLERTRTKERRGSLLPARRSQEFEYGPPPPPPWGAHVDQTGRALLLPGPRRAPATRGAPPPPGVPRGSERRGSPPPCPAARRHSNTGRSLLLLPGTARIRPAGSSSSLTPPVAQDTDAPPPIQASVAWTGRALLLPGSAGRQRRTRVLLLPEDPRTGTDGGAPPPPWASPFLVLGLSIPRDACRLTA
jgi:hypothetical protein